MKTFQSTDKRERNLTTLSHTEATSIKQTRFFQFEDLNIFQFTFMLKVVKSTLLTSLRVVHGLIKPSLRGHLKETET